MRKQGAGDPTLHFGAPHHPVHWKCQVCERGGGGFNGGGQVVVVVQVVL